MTRDRNDEGDIESEDNIRRSHRKFYVVCNLTDKVSLSRYAIMMDCWKEEPEERPLILSVTSSDH